MLTCALTGHRVLGKDFPAEGTEKKLRTLLENGTDTFLCGMALGFDLLCGEELAARKQAGAPLRLVACIPCADQPEGYAAADRARYERVLSACDEKVVLFPSYENGCMFARNRYMVDRCDALLAYLASSRGGTFYTVRYAEKRGKRVILLP